MHVDGLNISFIDFPPPIWLPVSADPPGAVSAAAPHPAVAQRHGASGSKSFRRRGQHSTSCSAPQEAPGALTARRQSGEDLDVFYNIPSYKTVGSFDCKLFASSSTLSLL